MHRLNVKKRHPVVLVETKKGQGYVPWPFVGDLLLFLRRGEAEYCVNWSVKLATSDFKYQRHSTLPSSAIDGGSHEGIALRHRIEEIYYADAGIRTSRVSAEQIDKSVYYNLRDLFGSLLIRVDLRSQQYSEAIAMASDAVDRAAMGSALIQNFIRSFALDRLPALALFRQLVWRRQVRIDLFEPIAMNRPLRMEKKDILTEYAHWFAK